MERKYIKKPWRHDPRSKNFSHTRFFGVAKTFPDTLGRPRKTPEDQQQSLRCAAYAGAMNGQYIHGIRMSPDWQTNKIGRIQGTSVDMGGSNPNAAMKSQVFVPQSDTSGGYLPYADWDPIKAEILDKEAANYGDEGYVKPDGGADDYDSICSALLLAYDVNTGKGAGVQAFSPWYPSFNEINITDITGTSFGGHSYLFIDFDRTKDVLIVENSYGEEYDNGFQYMTRPVVNRLFAQWGTSLKIPKPLTPAQIALAKQETPLGTVQRLLIQAWYALSEVFW